MSLLLLGITGHDLSAISGMPGVAIRQLGAIAAARLVAAVIIAVSAGIAVWQSIAMVTAAAWFWSASAVIATFTLAFSIQRLSACLSGPGLIRGGSELANWRPGRYRIGLMLIIGTAAAQPIILISQYEKVRVAINGQINELTLVQVARQRDALLTGDSALRLERAELVERLTLLQARPLDGLPKSHVELSTVSVPRRKAILVGAQRYPNAPLYNPARDVMQMAQKLTGMGFTVVTSVDDRGDVVASKLNRYFADLRPGDISLIYYSGHGFQRDGHNYIVPIDFDSERNANAIRVTRFLEAADRQSPQLQVVILDACREFIGAGNGVSSGGLAELQGGNNSFVAMAAKPGKLALDGAPGTSGIFTGAILRHIDRPEDINVIFRRISADVAKDARESDFEQQPVITSTLTREYVQLIDPQLAPPASPFEILPDQRNIPQAAVAKGSDIRCPPPRGMDLKFQRSSVVDCLKRRIAAIDQLLGDWRAASSRILRDSAVAYRDALRVSGLFMEKLQVIWSAGPMITAAFTLLIAMFLAAGEFMHFRYSDAVSRYVRRRNRQAVANLEESHLETERHVERELMNRRHPDYAVFEPFRTPRVWYGSDLLKADWKRPARVASDSERDAIRAWLGIRHPKPNLTQT
jgi:uncharacterized caspase-like protein